ncbi:hypothetical protein HPB48_006124 [Haemaphysalis longicornis]|uniref:CCHC-type domain-containing protein n=1 Tax=Haemaphysalis longicornis TaxID=44386 RepID=A0A9J6FYV6_HAELO|nr:hypothetical protein HPB48_006124 [Haemaphysalis longicornis]
MPAPGSVINAAICTKTTAVAEQECQKRGHIPREYFEDGGRSESINGDLDPRGGVCGGGDRGGPMNYNPLQKQVLPDRTLCEALPIGWGRLVQLQPTGHFSKNCQPRPNETSFQNCGKRRHITRESKEQEKQGHISRIGHKSKLDNCMYYNCGRLGHITSTCPEASGNDPVSDVCYQCNELKRKARKWRSTRALNHC